MQEQRRQEQHRHDVGPVEHPVESVETSAEREGQHAEERDIVLTERLTGVPVAVINTPWGLDISDITVRATGEDYVL